MNSNTRAHRTIERLALGTLVVMLAWSCGGNGGSSGTTGATPTTPTPPPVATPTVTGVSVSGAAPITGLTSQMTATASLSNGTTQSVTNLATWQSSNPNVATVSAGGLVSGRAPGAVDVTATYQNVNGIARLNVSAPPTYTLNGTVTDGTSGGILPGIRVSITTGTDTGKSTTTDGSGRYAISALSTGSVTVTASATSYTAVDKIVSISSDTRLDFVLPRTAPPPTTTPPPAGFGTGASVGLTTDSSTCRCWDATITFRINGINASTLSCSGSTQVAVAPGAYTLQGCDKTGCLTSTATVTLGQLQQYKLFCNASSAFGGGRAIR